jgi:hypothetical protein
MGVQNLQELVTTIEESNRALWDMITELHKRKAMLPTLAAQFNANEVKLEQSIHALSELKRALGLIR